MAVPALLPETILRFFYRRKAWGLFLLSLFAFHKSDASHVYGADLFYAHLHDSTYKVTLVIFGDCSGQLYPNLKISVPNVTVYQGTNEVAKLQLSLEDSMGVEVTPICSKMISQSACQMINGPIPGISRYIYTTEYHVPFRAKDWSFQFDGNMGSSQAGRSSNISNIDNAVTTGILTLSTTLNNLTLGVENSSPVYTTIPTPFYCINQKQQFNPGAVDPDGDSLVYDLVPAQNGKNYLRYAAGYSADTPVHAAPGSFYFDSLTGQINFIPDVVQRSLVVSKVTEYRNGIVVGTSFREMTFIVVKDCSGSPVYNKLDTIPTSMAGGIPDGPAFYACAETDSIHFQIIPEIPVPDTVFAEVNGLPKGATATIRNNKTPNPVITIGWKTLVVPPGSYHFFVTYTDNDCPMNSKQFQAYTINLTPRPVASISGPDTLCRNEVGSFAFDGTIGKGPQIEYIWDWDHPAYLEGQNAGPFHASWSNEKEKHLLLQVVENHCSSKTFEKIVQLKSTPYAYFDLPAEVCQHDSVMVQFVAHEIGNWDWTWYFDGAEVPGAKGEGPYAVRWNEPGKKVVRLNTTLNGCSDSTSREILVRPLPHPQIMNAPGPVCIGDKIFLRATGGSSYRWYPQDSVLYTETGELYGQILRPITYKVVATNDYGCFDSASISYNEIEPCCQFSYPNAFTPNNDGRNDRFRVVTHGNHLRYELSIYNQWGQRVYYGLDAEEGWDGSFKGKPCEPGAYFYYLNATCFTGRQESHKGDLMLLR